jgi:transposase
MKIKGTKYATMLDAMRAVVDDYGGPSAVKAAQAERQWTDMAVLWNLWHVCQRNLSYDDTHPAFAQGVWKRIIPQNTAFDMYSDDDNDTHLATALRKIGRELGL